MGAKAAGLQAVDYGARATPEQSVASSSLGWGVYYQPGDCAGLARRLVILAVDGIVLLVVAFWMLFLWSVFHSGSARPPTWLYLAWLVVALLYLVILERTRLGTLGYMVTGTRLVNLQGKRASIGAMLLRCLWLLFAPAAPLTLLMDVLWMTGERQKQTLRDKMAGTYVIKSRALPAGAGRQRIMFYLVQGLCLVVHEVGIQQG